MNFDLIIKHIGELNGLCRHTAITTTATGATFKVALFHIAAVCTVYGRVPVSAYNFALATHRVWMWFP